MRISKTLLTAVAASFWLGSALAATNSVALQAALREAAPDKKGIKKVLVVRGLDKMTGRATTFFAPIGKPVQFATLTIVARYCHSTPPLETPETTAFLQITDTRPGEQPRQVFSGWMFASAPEINAMEHPLYDVWVIACRTNQPGQEQTPVASNAPVKARSPDAGANEQLPELPAGAEQ